MRKKVITGGNKIIAFLMALLGFTGACKDGPWGGMVAAYGTPHADYIVKGNIASAKDNSILKGIRIIARDADSPFRTDTVKSDAMGNYQCKITDILVTNIHLSLTDVDGAINGTFEPLDTTVTYTNPNFTGGDGWYTGKTEKVLNLKMKPKP
jgi:putative lipoprotein (rSAM/lipoprotein system)